jgi:hypothetical protein
MHNLPKRSGVSGGPASPYKKAVKPEPVHPADPHVRIKKAVKPEPVYPADPHVHIKKAILI